LRRQPGFYGASIAELDLLVDLAQEVEGVLGSGLMGAGGGGIVEILAQEREEVGAAVQDALASGYYEPRGQPVQVERWRSVAAASRLEG
jgi:galactokinase